MNKTQFKKIKDRLKKKNTLVFDQLTKTQKSQVFKFNDLYKDFLDQSKTEREAAQQIVKIAEGNGFVNIDILASKKKQIQKVYKVFQGRCVAMAVLGKDSLVKGANIIASHIDSPRLDLKQNPIYEDLSMGLLKTHYYGGIRKYHWLAMPLALHGTIVTSNGPIDICVGEKPDDPVFTVTDLLPHLAGKLQADKKISDVFEGEKLNLLAGSIPLGGDKEKDRFKLGVLNLLFEEYKITEEDFVSAEIEAVPAEKARDIGFDRSMIGSYGQDDRVCAYTSFKAILDTKQPLDRTAIALFFDKEEIGSEGSSGAKSNFLEDFMSDLLFISGQDMDNRSLRKTLINSSCLSADVNAAMDPDYKGVHEEMNAAKLGYGVCMTKFTGVGGKSGSSDASAEFVGKIRQIFNKNKIVWQTGELGKIDQGGGGTVAKFLAKFGMNVLDCGPAVLSMHSPFEISSKADVYMTYLGYKAFYNDNDSGNGK